jgi:hypothetical protein
MWRPVYRISNAILTLVAYVQVHLASLVLSDLVLGVLLAVPALAVGAASLGNVDLTNHARQQTGSNMCLFQVQLAAGVL